MATPEDHFGESVASAYDQSVPALFSAKVLGPTVDLLAELDLMARLAGLSLLERCSGWYKAPFTAESTSHVSVWQKGA